MPVPGDNLQQDPDARLYWDMNWTDFLPSGVTISASSWFTSGEDANLLTSSDSILGGSLIARVRLVGGTLGVRYRVVNRVDLSDGQEDDRSFWLSIVEM